MNALDDVVLVVEELEVAPPPMNCPIEPFTAAIVPLVGAVNTAAVRLFCAVCRAAAAPATALDAASSSGCVAAAVDDANDACCVTTEACAWDSEFCAVCRATLSCAIVFCRPV